MKKTTELGDFDFGFSLVDEDELDTVQQANEQIQNLSGSSTKTQQKLDNLYNAIQPLLNNLAKNPEKEFIKWPGRAEKIEQFSDHLTKIYND